MQTNPPWPGHGSEKETSADKVEVELVNVGPTDTDDEFEGDVVLAHAVKVWFPSLSPA